MSWLNQHAKVLLIYWYPWPVSGLAVGLLARRLEDDVADSHIISGVAFALSLPIVAYLVRAFSPKYREHPGGMLILLFEVVAVVAGAVSMSVMPDMESLDLLILAVAMVPAIVDDVALARIVTTPFGGIGRVPVLQSIPTITLVVFSLGVIGSMMIEGRSAWPVAQVIGRFAPLWVTVYAFSIFVGMYRSEKT